MRVQTKIIMGAIATVIVGVMMTLGLSAIFLNNSYTWNSIVDLEFISPYVSMRLDASINDTTFTSVANHGEVDQTYWQIPNESTTFTKQQNSITLSLKFTNNATVPLRVTISGILIDAKNRFSTSASLNSTVLPISVQTNSTGIVIADIPGGVGEEIMVNLMYILTSFNLSIGGDDATQTLTLSIEQMPIE